MSSLVQTARYWLYGAIFSGLLCGTGCEAEKPIEESTPSVNLPQIKEETWQVWSAEGAPITVEMPGQPIELTWDDSIEIHGVQFPGEVEFTVAWSNHRDDVARLGIDSALTAAVASQTFDCRVLQDDPLAIQGRVGREVVSVDPDGFVLHCRIILSGDMLLQVGYVAPESIYDKSNTDLQRFLKSVKL